MANQLNPPPAGPNLDLGLKNQWWTPRLAGPVVFAAVARFAFLAVALARTGTSAVLGTDTYSYLIPGRNLVLHGAFFADGVPALMRTPGYPLFLALTSLAGFTLAAVVNLILSLFCLVLIWRFARAVSADERIAVGAAWLLAIEPISSIFSVVLLSETLFVAFLLFGMERLAWFLRSHRLGVLAVGGFSLVAATFVRPVGYYLPIALAIGLVVVLARVKDLRWKAPVVLLITVLPWLAAWQIRNKVETGYSGFSSARELNLYTQNGVEVTAKLQHRNYFDVREEFGYAPFVEHSGQTYLSQPYVDRHREQAGWTQAQRIAFMGAEGKRIIRAHPGVYVRTCIQPLFAMVLDPGAGYFGRMLGLEGNQLSNGVAKEGAVRWAIFLVKTYPGLVALKLAFEAVLLALYLLALRGILRGSIRNPYLALMLGTVLYFVAVCAVAGGTGSDARYRIPIMPFVCVFAAAGPPGKKTAAA
ncbi:MAG TPA: hypothetical protein VN776_10605 [Terracidiphilus sp.]|nr:hypothetical protein [Terracidiphilus sp.]